MDYSIAFAQAFKDRDNIERIGAVIGKVISENPIKVSVLAGTVILDSSHLFVCKNATDYDLQVTTNNGTGIAKHEGVKIGDKVMLMATESGQRFFLIDKVV